MPTVTPVVPAAVTPPVGPIVPVVPVWPAESTVAPAKTPASPSAVAPPGGNQRRVASRGLGRPGLTVDSRRLGEGGYAQADGLQPVCSALFRSRLRYAGRPAGGCCG